MDDLLARYHTLEGTWPSSELAELRQLIQLRHLSLSIQYHHLGLEDEDLDRLTKDMANLEILDLTGPRNHESLVLDRTNQLGLYEDALVHLARNCPMLRELYVRLNLSCTLHGYLDAFVDLADSVQPLRQLEVLDVVQSQLLWQRPPFSEDDPMDRRPEYVEHLISVALALAITTSSSWRLDYADDPDDYATQTRRGYAGLWFVRPWVPLPRLVQVLRTWYLEAGTDESLDEIDWLDTIPNILECFG